MTSARHNIRRRRAANSCESCRRRKIRCDQKLPCGACVRARDSMMCIYRDGKPSQAMSDEGSQTSNIQDNSPSTGIQTSSPSTTTTQAQQSDAESSIARNDGDYPRPGPSLRKTLLQNSTPFTPDSSIKEASAPSISIPAPPARLRQATDKTKMFGQSHWVHLADKVRFSPPLTVH